MSTETAAQWQLEQHQTQEEDIWCLSRTFLLLRLYAQHSLKEILLIIKKQKLKRAHMLRSLTLNCNLIATVVIHSEKKIQPASGNMRNLRTYSCAPIWVPSLCRRELGGIEPHQRGEGLRHPVGNHRHGAEHDADLQQRHRHLCALLGLYSSRLHSTDSGEKQGRRVMLPRVACCFTRDSGSAGLFLDISNEALAANESDAIVSTETGISG